MSHELSLAVEHHPGCRTSGDRTCCAERSCGCSGQAPSCARWAQRRRSGAPGAASDSRTSRRLGSLVGALGLLAFSGCAAARLPDAGLAGYDASVRAAEALGAREVPETRRHLRLAEAQSANAKALAAGGDARSVLVLERAQADAELSVAKAKALSMRVNARRADEALSALQTRGGR